VHARAFADDLDRDCQDLGGPGDQFAGVAGIGPDQPDGWQVAAEAPPQPPAAIAVLGAGRGDQDLQQQPTGVHRQVAVAAVDLLGRVLALGRP
jgi:hypothetical protein